MSDTADCVFYHAHILDVKIIAKDLSIHFSTLNRRQTREKLTVPHCLLKFQVSA